MNPYWVFSKRSEAPGGQNENPTWGLDGANKPQGFRMLTLNVTQIHPMTYGQGQGYRFKVTSLKNSIY